MEKICGTVDTIIFASQDNRFTVLKLSPEKLSTQITSITAAGGKLLYPESGLYEVLKKNYKDFRRYAG